MPRFGGEGRGFTRSSKKTKMGLSCSKSGDRSTELEQNRFPLFGGSSRCSRKGCLVDLELPVVSRGSLKKKKE